MIGTSNTGSRTCNELLRWSARTPVWKQDSVLKTAMVRGRYCSWPNLPSFLKTQRTIPEPRRAPERARRPSIPGHRFNAAIYFFPVHVLEKRVDVFRCGCAVIHVVSVFVHVEHEQRVAQRHVVHVVPRPIIMKLTRVRVVREDHPT